MTCSHGKTLAVRIIVAPTVLYYKQDLKPASTFLAPHFQRYLVCFNHNLCQPTPVSPNSKKEEGNRKCGCPEMNLVCEVHLSSKGLDRNKPEDVYIASICQY